MNGSRAVLLSALALGIFGNLIHFLGLANLIKPCLILPIFVVLIAIITKISFFGRLKSLKTWEKPEKLLFGLIIIQLAIYSLGLLVPETSFDALWYHLPEAQVYANTGSIQPIPELLYSTMPRLGEMLLISGFLAYSPFLVKLTTFIITLLFLNVSYYFAKLFLPRFWALLSTLALNSIFIIAWQSTAGYIDLTRALFEISGLYVLMVVFKKKKHLLPLAKVFNNSPSLAKEGVRGSLVCGRLGGIILAGIFMGFTLSTKIHSFTTLIASIVFIIASNYCHLEHSEGSNEAFKKTIKQLFLFLTTALLIASPWYIYNWHHSGHPLYPLNNPAKQLDQLTYAGTGSIIDWIIHQTFTLPRIFWDLSFNNARFLTPIILLLLPIAWLNRRLLYQKHLPLILYTLFFILFWWFTPPSRKPLSSRSCPRHSYFAYLVSL